MSSNFLSLNPSETEFIIFGLPQQLSELNTPTIHLPNNVILSPVDSARNLGVIFNKNLSFAQYISSISKSCLLNIRDIRRIRNTIDQTTACTIATSIVTLLLNLPATQTNRLQLVLNSATRAVTKTPKFHHITPILKSLHWLKINERIKYKVLSLSHINLSKLISLLTSALFFHPLHTVVLSLPLLSPSVAFLSPLVLKYQIDLSIILLLFYATISYLIYIRLFITPLLLLFQTRLCLIFQPLFSLRI